MAETEWPNLMLYPRLLLSEVIANQIQRKCVKRLWFRDMFGWNENEWKCKEISQSRHQHILSTHKTIQFNS